MLFAHEFSRTFLQTISEDAQYVLGVPAASLMDSHSLWESCQGDGRSVAVLPRTHKAFRDGWADCPVSPRLLT